MAVFAIADLHLSLATNKAMDAFPGWDNYVAKIKQNWESVVSPNDTVVIAGDISWAMKLEDTFEDFNFINSLPGVKLFLKGNHDYWWTTVSKMQTYIEKSKFNSIKFLHNNSYSVSNISICGTRGWLFSDGEKFDKKIMNREIGRLNASLKSAEDAKEKIVFLHYPPIAQNISSPELIEVMKQHKVKRCYYGHLHGESKKWAIQGILSGTNYTLISADALDFSPIRII